jgi:hypothetical protein
MQKVLIELQYLAPITYYAKLLQYDEIIIEQHENLIKSSYRNRCYIMAANGILRLSIPIDNGRDHKALYTDVNIDYRQRWKAIHWQSIVSAYKHAPFFEHYSPYFEKLYLETNQFSLFQWNLKLLETTFKILKISTPIGFSESYQKNVSENIVDARNLISHKNTCQPPFEPYIQVFSEKHGFQADLSVLDLIFNLGTSAKSYLIKI